MAITVEQQLKNSLEFLKGSYPTKWGNPPAGFKVKVITDKFNVYIATYQGIGIYETEDGYQDEENIVAWKHINSKKIIYGK